MQGIHHVALRVADCEISARFYEQVFGGRMVRRMEKDGATSAIWLHVGGTILMLERTIRGEGQSAGSGHVLVFPSEDLAAAEQGLQAMGIPVTDRTPSTLFMQDPDGHRAGLSIYRFDELGS